MIGVAQGLQIEDNDYPSNTCRICQNNLACIATGENDVKNGNEVENRNGDK